MDNTDSDKVFSGKVLVTGAAGFIGRNIVQALCARDCSVRAAVHREEQAGRFKGMPVELAAGDILNPAFVNRIVEGVGAVVHLAAVIKGADKDLLFRTNVEGTVNLVKACDEKGVRRFVFMSTPQVYAPVPTAYGESKRAAEGVVVESGLEWTIIRPVLVYGAGDTKDLTCLAHLVFRWPVIPVLGGEVSIQPVYIDDVAEAVLRILEREASIGESYYLAGPRPISMNDFINFAARIAGKRCYKIHIPLRLAMLLAFVMEKFTRRPLLTRDVVKRIAEDRTADISKTKSDLGLSPRDVKEGLSNIFAACR